MLLGSTEKEKSLHKDICNIHTIATEPNASMHILSCLNHLSKVESNSEISTLTNVSNYGTSIAINRT